MLFESFFFLLLNFYLLFDFRIEDYGRNFGEEYTLRFKYLGMFLVVNIIIYIYELVMGAIYTDYYLEDPDNFDDDHTLVYNIEIYAIIFYNFILGVGFAGTGLLRIGKIHYSGDSEKSKKEIIIVSNI